MTKIMNEKIKNIALQVGGSHYPEVGGAYLEKTVQIVVEDCVKIIERWTKDDPAFYGLALEILEHFELEIPK